jgi:hypothetical protein
VLVFCRCDSGYFSAADGLTLCVACIKGKIALNGKGTGSTGCVDCVGGKYSRADHQVQC